MMMMPVGFVILMENPDGSCLAGAQVMKFTEAGQSPEMGTTVRDAIFSADGTTATGSVPNTVANGSHFVTIHLDANALDVPVFNALPFFVQ